MNQMLEFFFRGLGGTLLAGGVSIPFLITITTLFFLKPTTTFKGRYVIIGTLSSFGFTHILTSMISPVAYILGHTSPSKFLLTAFALFSMLILPIVGSLVILIPLANFFKLNLAQPGGAADALSGRR
jgi:hypothetical protein